MAELMNLVGDVEGTIAQRSAPARERTLSKITELLVRDADRLDGDQLALFDHVLGCFTPTVPGSAKADLAQRLADLGNPPPNVTRTLAFDEDIVVAHAILSRSAQLSDQDLIDIAILRGTEHMGAIAERRAVSELVTDVLVTHGDDSVWRAVAGNEGARFSALAKAELLDHARQDEGLQDLLGARADLSDEDMQQLVAVARETAKARLTSTLAKVEERAAAASKPLAPVGLNYSRAQDELRAFNDKRPLSEFDVATFATRHLAAEAICAISRVTHLPIPTIERAFRERDDDLILVIGKANNWSWRTVRALIGMHDPLLPPPRERPLGAAFDAISAAGARRTLIVLANAGKAAKAAQPAAVKPAET